MAILTILYAIQAANLAAAIVPLQISTSPMEMYGDDAVCLKYVCASKQLDMVNNTCIFFDTDRYVLKPCEGKLDCPSEFQAHNVTCVEPEMAVAKKYPGEKCKQNTDCMYGNCVMGACFNKQAGEACTSHEECNPSLYCAAGVCTSQIVVGEKGCTDDWQCQNNAGCDNGVCKEYFSVPSKEWVGSCPSNHTNYVCESTFCFNGLCLDAPASSFPTSQFCTTDQVCISRDYEESEGVLFYSSCTCGNNKDGNKFCSLFPGDKDYSKLLSQYRTWMKSSEVMKCNTVRRWTYECIYDYSSPKVAEEVDYYFTVSVNSPQLQDADDCVYEIAYPSYYKTLEEDDDYSSSLLVSIFLLLTLI